MKSSIHFYLMKTSPASEVSANRVFVCAGFPRAHECCEICIFRCDRTTHSA